MTATEFTWPGKRVLVSGATGFIGSGTTQKLLDLNANVTALTRSRPPSELVNWVHIEPDSRFPSNQIADFDPEIFIHLATRFQASHESADIKELIRSNIEFGTNLLESARQSDAMFININSSWQHYESKPYSPVSLYAATKQAFADIAQYYGETGLDLRNLTIYDTYGPTDQRNKLIRQLLTATRDGQQIDMGQGNQLINLLYLSDVVEAILQTASLPSTPREHKYVARSLESISLRDLVGVIESVTGKGLNAQWGAREERPREMLTDWVFGEELPGWKQKVSLEEGLSFCWQELGSAA